MPLKPGNQWLPSPEPIVFLGLGVNTALTIGSTSNPFHG